MIAFNQQSGREKPPEFLSTHPTDQIRIDSLIKNLAPALVNYNAAHGAGKRPACSISR
jgi:predicted Zn-dependent protease